MKEQKRKEKKTVIEQLIQNKHGEEKKIEKRNLNDEERG